MFFHSQQQTPNGFPIKQLLHEFGIANRAYFYDDYLSQFGSGSHEVVEQMNMFDVLLHPSQTEGFGLTIIEAQACGVPGLVNNIHSMPELVIPGKTGEVCKTDRRRFTADNSWVWTADVNDLAECMERLYNNCMSLIQ
jgi:glycosyltransferase involved in cell wall biosynthesis